MRNILRKTWDLFWRNPILWVPYLCAGLLAFSLSRLGIDATQAIYHRAQTGHTVLGGEVRIPMDNYALAKARWESISVRLTVTYINICLFVMAFMITARLVGTVLDGEQPDFRKALHRVARRWTAVLMFSLKLSALFTFVGFGFGWLLVPHMERIHRYSPRLYSATISLGILVEVGLVSWILTPAAIRMIRRVNVGSLTTFYRCVAAAFIVIATETEYGLGLLVHKLETAIVIGSGTEANLISVFNSVVTNGPDVLLFIALTLLPLQVPTHIDNKRAEGVRRFLHVLMPLHFQKRNEFEGAIIEAFRCADRV